MNKSERETHNRVTVVLLSLGFTEDEITKMRRISNTLQRWHELECGTGEGQFSRNIERDGDDGEGKPYLRVQYPTTAGYVDKRWPIADREAGARKRLAGILADRNARNVRPINAGYYGVESAYTQVEAFVQTDPRGAALYILRPGDVPAGAEVDSCYSRGVCVY